MPELPEVETVRRGLEPVMLGRRLSAVEVRRSDLRIPVPKDFARLANGRKITSLERRGKYILVFFENRAGEAVKGFGLHLGMSGRVKIFKVGDVYEPAAHDHLIFTTDKKTRIIFNDPRRFGMVFVLEDNWEKQAPFSNMGPEPLGNSFDEESMLARIGKKNAPIKTVLLDQAIVAGIGNIYACEALFHAGIHPARKAAAVSRKKTGALVKAVREVLSLAIEAGGSTLRDHRKTDGSEGYFQHRFSVYDREGKACPGCSCDPVETGGIRRIVQAGRSTFYCPGKQT